ncbi:hypothetical protein FB639_000498 [Coemansia asiatica]|nr:hypothetical protein FB639_000498 [Coemansia asiatica]
MAFDAGPIYETSLGDTKVLLGPAAAVHKHPFTAMSLDEEVTNESIYVSGGNSDWEVNGVSKAVRVFIGSTSIEWMQRHQRWWVRTAEKLESKTGAGRKISRRGAKSDSASDLFDMGSHKKNHKKASSSVESLALASKDETHRQQKQEGIDGHGDSDWSSDSDQSIEEIGDEDLHCKYSHEQNGNSADTHTLDTMQLSTRTVPVMELDPSVSSLDTIPMINVPVPMPMLPDSPMQDKKPPNTAPVQSNTVRNIQSVMDIRHSMPEKARRRSSLSAIKGFFRRSDKKQSHVYAKSTNSPRSTATAATEAAINAESLDTIPIVLNRGRAASISGIAGAGVSTPMVTTPTKRSSSLRRTAVSRQARTVTWLANDDEENAGAEDEQLLQGGWIPKALLRSKSFYGAAADTTVILAARAVVRLETAALSALVAPYTEITCRSQRVKVHEWAEMWIVLTARGILFYCASRTRPATQVLFPPYAAVPPRLSVFSPLDVSLALAYATKRGGARVVVFKMRTAPESYKWYIKLRELIGGGSAQVTVPKNITINVPELGVKVQVDITTPATNMWMIRHAAMTALLEDCVIEPRAQAWIEDERKSDLRVGMAWRRGGRLTWVAPSGGVDKSTGRWRVFFEEGDIICPPLLEGSHKLEMRTIVHYPDSAMVQGSAMQEPPGVEGFLMLKRSGASLAAYRPILLTAHDGLLFLIHAPRAARHLDVTANAYASNSAEHHANSNDKASCARYYHPDAYSCSKQMCQARYMIKLAAVWEISAVENDADEKTVQDDSAVDAGARSRAKARVKRFIRTHKPAQCKFRLTTRAGTSVILWAESEACMQEWVRRLTELKLYWIHRALADVALRSRSCILNYALQGRERDLPTWSDERAFADRAVWHACLVLGCRNIIHAGMLYRKRHKHQGMRRVFCVLTRGHLVEYDYPHALVNDDELVAHVQRQDPLMAQMTLEIGTSNANAQLLFPRSRSLSLRRCYVVSRRADDLTTEDIMCEPWVMTDIGNYSGLRLADRLYADGVVSHDFIDDCVFTVWRPKFTPPIIKDFAAGKEGGASAVSVEALLSDDSREERQVSFSPPMNPRQTHCSPRSSSDAHRLSNEGYGSSVSASSSRSYDRAQEPSANAAARKSDDIRVGADGFHDKSTKRMSAMAMASGMRPRLGVFKARTNTEMELWVTALNQEIRRMVEADTW